MEPFEIITTILSALGLLGAIITVHIKSQIDIVKLQTTLKFFQKDLDNKEISICTFEKNNKEDHKEIMVKIDSIIEKFNANERYCSTIGKT
jgi:hypothetical protein